MISLRFVMDPPATDVPDGTGTLAQGVWGAMYISDIRRPARRYTMLAEFREREKSLGDWWMTCTNSEYRWEPS